MWLCSGGLLNINGNQTGETEEIGKKEILRKKNKKSKDTSNINLHNPQSPPHAQQKPNLKEPSQYLKFIALHTLNSLARQQFI